jgi:hypothetical protein
MISVEARYSSFTVDGTEVPSWFQVSKFNLAEKNL